MDNLTIAELFTGDIEEGIIIEECNIEDGLPIEEELPIEKNKKETRIAICIIATLCVAYIVVILYLISPII